MERESRGDSHLFTSTGSHPLCLRQWGRGFGTHAIAALMDLPPFLENLVPQYPLAVSVTKVTAGWGGALLLSCRIGSAQYRCADKRSSVEELPFIKRPSLWRHFRFKQHNAVPDLEGQRPSLRMDIHTRPGTDKGVTRKITRSARLASPSRTSCVAPRSWLPPRPHSKCAL